MERVEHPFEPVLDGHSRVLILGSFPSVRSRAQHFYYGHPQNRFWKVLAAVFGGPVPETIPQKREMLRTHGIALWDSIARCRIVGSSDARIADVEANDIAQLLQMAPIETIGCNGRKSLEVYRQYVQSKTGREALYLPSTSPANAAWSLERLVEAWRPVLRRAELPR